MAAKDTICIIGAGMAGLCAGSYLAKQGYKVKVLEANSKVGGSCGTTTLNSYIFNDGAQYLMLPSMLDYVFSRLGFERDVLCPVRRVTTPQTVILDNGCKVSVGDGLEVNTRLGSVDARLAQAELKSMLEKWTPILQIFTDESFLRKPISVRQLLSKAWRHIPKLGRHLEAEFRILFSDPDFRSVMAAHLLFAGAPPRRLPSVSIIALVSMLKEGLFLPEGGMGLIPDALAYTLKQNGGELLLNADVRRIIVKNGHVCGLDVDPYGEIETNAVISTASAMATFQFLVDRDNQPGSLKRKVSRARLSMKAFGIQLGLSNSIDADSHLNYKVPEIEGMDNFYSPKQAGIQWAYYSVPTLVMPELAPPGGSIVELFPAIRSDEPVEAWDDQRTERFSASAIEWLSLQHNIEVAVKRVLSPRQYQDQLRLYQGAIYGLSPVEGIMGLFSHKTPIQGLFLAGQGTYPGFGIPSSALSGIYAAEALLSTR
jgi:phytoene desaturase